MVKRKVADFDVEAPSFEEALAEAGSRLQGRPDHRLPWSSGWGGPLLGVPWLF